MPCRSTWRIFWWGDILKDISRANQESLGRLPEECPASGGNNPRHRSVGTHQKPLPWRIHWWPGFTEGAVSREFYGMGIIGRGVGWGGPTEFVDSLYWSTKYPARVVVFCPACYPAHRVGVPPGGGGNVKILHPRSFPGVTSEFLMRGITRLPIK